MLGLDDPSTAVSNPGWPLRNFLVLAAKHWYVVIIQLSHEHNSLYIAVNILYCHFEHITVTNQIL